MNDIQRYITDGLQIAQARILLTQLNLIIKINKI